MKTEGEIGAGVFLRLPAGARTVAGSGQEPCVLGGLSRRASAYRSRRSFRRLICRGHRGDRVEQRVGDRHRFKEAKSQDLRSR